MKRLGIFFFYEKNGDVDDFITYYLADLNKNLTELVVVCNGKLSEQGRAAFSQFTDNIIVRENKGLDVWAYKTALDSYGWAKLSEFDEIVMTNSTLMVTVQTNCGNVQRRQQNGTTRWAIPSKRQRSAWGKSLSCGRT